VGVLRDQAGRTISGVLEAVILGVSIGLLIFWALMFTVLRKWWM
jgi:hypothetical protein